MRSSSGRYVRPGGGKPIRMLARRVATPLNYDASYLSPIMKTLLLQAIVIAIGYCSSILLCYRGRSMDAHPLFHSDLFVFIVPTVIAVMAYSALFWRNKPIVMPQLPKGVVSMGLAIAVTFILMLLSVLVAFNMHGT